MNSLITNFEDGAEVKAGQPVKLQGIAWDGGYGIVEVAVSVNAGKEWISAELGADLGRFAWRQWSYSFTPAQAGAVTVMARARNAAGQTKSKSCCSMAPATTTIWCRRWV